MLEKSDYQKDNETSKEVELDTDGIQEQSIEVEKQSEVESNESEPREEVDLGYTEPKAPGIEGISVEEKEEKEEKKVDDLSDVSEKVRRRIDKLTFKIRESERRERAALEYAKSIQSKLDDSETKYNKTSKSYVEQYSARVVAEQEKARQSLKDAINEQDADKIADANSLMAKLAIEAEKAKMTAAEEEEREANRKTQVPQPQQTTPPPQNPTYPEPSRKAQNWAESNEWFGSDKIMTSAAFQIHQDLIDQGFDVESQEYYNEIDKTMKDNFPHKFNRQEPKKIVQTVASAQRNQNGRRSVKLTRSQIAIAKKLGVPLEEYAKYVKENANG
jgi:hypothetical protein